MICPKCKKEIPENQKFCPECGTNIAAPANALVEGLIKKIKLESYVWLAIAGIQVLTALLRLLSGDFVSLLLLAFMAFINIKGAKEDLDYCKKIAEEPAGIVEKYKPLKELAIAAALNVVLGYAFGAIGCIFGFLTRKYVLDHEADFLALEPAEQPAEVPAQ